MPACTIIILIFCSLNVQSGNSGTCLETDDGSSDQLLSMVSELEKGRKDLERKVANLFMDNISLVKKLKASRAAEMEQMKGINSLENQLAQALKTQVNVHIYMHAFSSTQCSDVVFSSILVCTQEANAKELSLVTTEKSHLEDRIWMLEVAMCTEPTVETEIEIKEHRKGLPAEVGLQSECVGVYKHWCIYILCNCVLSGFESVQGVKCIRKE